MNEMLDRLAALHFQYPAPLETLPGCPLCEHEHGQVVAEVDRYRIPARFVRCDRCGLVYLNPRMGKQGYLEFYEHWYRPLLVALTGKPYSAEYALDRQTAYGQATLNWISKFLHGGRSLDMGGSIGAFAGLLQDRGFEAHVLDPCANELARAAARGLLTHHGLAEDFQTELRFDLCSMLQSIDHILDPLAVLSKMRELITPDGLVVVDFIDFEQSVRGSGIQGAVKIDHTVNFTDQTARLALEKAGLKIVREGCPRELPRHHLFFACQRA